MEIVKCICGAAVDGKCICHKPEKDIKILIGGRSTGRTHAIKSMNEAIASERFGYQYIK